MQEIGTCAGGIPGLFLDQAPRLDADTLRCMPRRSHATSAIFSRAVVEHEATRVQVVVHVLAGKGLEPSHDVPPRLGVMALVAAPARNLAGSDGAAATDARARLIAAKVSRGFMVWSSVFNLLPSF